MNRKFGILAAITLLISLMAAIPASAQAADVSQELQDEVGVDGIRAHQAALQAIADANGGTRVAGSAGYDASVDYVVDQLNAAGYDVDVQSFDFDFFEVTVDGQLSQSAPVAATYVDQTDFDVMTFSGSGDTGSVPVTPVDLALADPASSTSGCEIEDFDGFAAGTIALMQRGACSFAQKAQNAEASGAVGAVIFNQGNTPEREALLFGTLGGPGSNIPVMGTSFAVGEALAVDATAAMSTQTISETRTTQNVIAQSTTGNPDDVVMAGAHLDSVPDGAGIQDNGTGSGAILEIALQLAEDFGANDASSSRLENSVRFGWWGAEEFGLLGSIDYVVNLSDEELAKIAVYQNYDMIGSPNFVRFVYDGDGSDITPGIFVPAASSVLEQTFLDHFASKGLANEPTIIGQRSDHFAFCVSGVPCGGLFTGAEVLKTAEQVAIYGGVEGEQYDQCYHAACDDFDNISLTALDQMSDAAADAMATYLFTPLCNGVPATIIGTDRNDVINGTNGDDVIVTFGGRDNVAGKAGDDIICLGDGDDRANGGQGDDIILGEGGDDNLSGSTGNDSIDGGDDRDTIKGESGDDTLIGGDGGDRIEGAGGDDNIDAGDGKDTALGGSGNDTMNMGAGDDKALGGANDDTINGGDGKDNISGNDGNDTLNGDSNKDVINGGRGDDALDGGTEFDKLNGEQGNDSCVNGESERNCESGAALAARSLSFSRTFGSERPGSLAPQFHDHDGHRVSI